MPIADSAFFTDAPRPITQQRIRFDANLNVLFMDRATYLWARADGFGEGPLPPSITSGGTNPLKAYKKLRFYDLSLYTEIASGKFSFTVNVPYRSLYADPTFHHAGFSDITVGTKTLLYDVELMQVAMIFNTYIPSGVPTEGLGNGHVSLEPSLLIGLKLGPETYLQTQVAEWIPLGGDPFYQGSILHYHFSLNHTLWRILPDVPLIGTAEFSGFSFQDGAYTDPYLGSFQQASGYSYLFAGTGLRLFICNRLDFGIGIQYSIQPNHWADPLIRSEFRFRY